MHFKNRTNIMSNTLSNNRKQDIKLIMRAGDIESNPGPIIPEIQILEEQNMYLSFKLPTVELYPVQPFDFEEFAISRIGIEKLRQRMHNYIYSCPGCKDINECFKVFMTFYIKTKVTLSNTMVAIITECMQRKRCAYCLEYTKNRPNKFLPTGFICVEECEGKYMN